MDNNKSWIIQGRYRKRSYLFCIELLQETRLLYAKKSNSDAEWQEIGEQGKKALSETGKFFSDAGKKIYEEATTPECYGKWICKNGKSRTTVECKQNGSMTVTQKSGGKNAKWSGTFTATSHTITFKISIWKCINYI